MTARWHDFPNHQKKQTQITRSSHIDLRRLAHVRTATHLILVGWMEAYALEAREIWDIRCLPGGLIRTQCIQIEAMHYTPGEVC